MTENDTVANNTYTFDSNGNETASSSSDSLSYNSKNQSTSITHGGTNFSCLAYSGGDQPNRTTAGSGRDGGRQQYLLPARLMTGPRKRIHPQ